jgi:hypothetical protein
MLYLTSATLRKGCNNKHECNSEQSFDSTTLGKLRSEEPETEGMAGGIEHHP